MPPSSPSIRSIPFSPCLPPLPDSPASSVESAESKPSSKSHRSKVTFSPRIQADNRHQNGTCDPAVTEFPSFTSTASVSSSTSDSRSYQSPLLQSPVSHDPEDSCIIRLDTTTDEEELDQIRRDEDEEEEEEEEEESSSDIEIYLSSLDINDSTSGSGFSSQTRHNYQPIGSLQQQQQQNQAFETELEKSAANDSLILSSSLLQNKTLLPTQTRSSSPQPRKPPPSKGPLPAQSSNSPEAHKREGPKFIFTPAAPSFTPKTAAVIAMKSTASSHPPSHPSHAPRASTYEAEDPTKPDAVGRTPNVYINGLPPHFPEDQLYALAAPYGPIISVRTFTRHVRDTESGYGFVLFKNVDSAEACIVSLRRYRNLHPTFSRQAHKIPGTIPVSAAGDNGDEIQNQSLVLPMDINIHTDLPLHVGSVPPSQSTYSACTLVERDQERDMDHMFERDVGDMGESASFKAKMESLHDKTSTNLYMEGLPLSIDEPTLAALVAPHRISSSRFFQTRLSNPPRIIAFVRLETRIGAEEVIERLHGRMVRGWNDPGSRISVRFADTAEQRELRRTERMAREGEESPARLSIAQASLLNLHGSTKCSLPPAPSVSSLVPTVVNRSQPAPIPPRTHTHTPPFQVDYSLAGRQPYFQTSSRPQTQVYSQSQAPTPQVPLQLHSRPYTPIHAQAPYYNHLHPIDASLSGSLPQTTMDPAMANLLGSLRTRHQGSATLAAAAYQDPSAIYNGHGLVHGHGHDYAPSFARNRHTSGGAYQYGDIEEEESHEDVDDGLLYTQPQQIGNRYFRGTDLGPQLPLKTRMTGPGTGTGQARGGYTATEEFIMRAHAESAAAQQQYQQQRRRLAPLSLDAARRRRDSDASLAGGGSGTGGSSSASIGIGMRAHRVSAPSKAQISAPHLLGMSDGMPLVGEDEFHAGAGTGGLRQHPSYQGLPNHHRVHPIPGNNRLSRESVQQQQTVVNQEYQHDQSPSLGSSSPQVTSETPLLSSLVSPNPNQHYYQQAHLRSFTLPQRTAPAAVPSTRHYQHNSLSVAGSVTGKPQERYLLHSLGNINGGENGGGGGVVENGNRGNHGNEDMDKNIQDSQLASIMDYDKISRQQQQQHTRANAPLATRYHHPNHRHQSSQSQGRGQNQGYERGRGQDSSSSRHHRSQSRSQGQVQPAPTISIPPSSSSSLYDGTISGSASVSSPDPSPSLSLISPALTYCSSQHSHTPSTLSPATPFFNTFRVNVGQEDQREQVKEKNELERDVQLTGKIQVQEQGQRLNTAEGR